GGITAFYDIDTPITLSKLKRHDYEYISHELIPEYDLYLSFSGGDVLRRLEEEYNASRARPLYCSVDTDLYYPESKQKQWQLGYLGAYSSDRQPTLNTFMIHTAEVLAKDSFVVAGPQYPPDLKWPKNVSRIEHLPPAEHRDFYNRQAFTLNVTRDAMIEAGFSPSVRLFEAAACGVPIITDYWEGLEHFFKPGDEILVAGTTRDVQHYLNYPPEKSEELSRRARHSILQNHTSLARAKQLTGYIRDIITSDYD